MADAGSCARPAVKAGAAHKKRFESWLEEMFEAAGTDAPATLARRVVILMDGAFASALIHRDTAYVLEAGNAAREMISESTERSDVSAV